MPVMDVLDVHVSEESLSVSNMILDCRKRTMPQLVYLMLQPFFRHIGKPKRIIFPIIPLIKSVPISLEPRTPVRKR